MPPSAAFLTFAFIASGFASVTAIPSTFWSIAVCTRFAWSAPSGAPVYWSSTLSLAAAASAPLRTRSQNVSPCLAWVMNAIFIRGVSATLPDDPLAFSSSCLPPEELQAPSAATSTSAAPVATAFFCHRTMTKTSLSDVPR